MPEHGGQRLDDLLKTKNWACLDEGDADDDQHYRAWIEAPTILVRFSSIHENRYDKSSNANQITILLPTSRPFHLP